jgi:hypothetical protein
MGDRVENSIGDVVVALSKRDYELSNSPIDPDAGIDSLRRRARICNVGGELATVGTTGRGVLHNI